MQPARDKERYARKKVNQSRRWQETVIPALEMPYLDYLAWTNNLRLNPPCISPCSCPEAAKKRSLKILGVYINRLETVNLSLCDCTPVAQHLLLRGLFPCAPHMPSLAFDLNMLELVSTLFLNIAPNVTAWASTLESFLGVREYKLRTRDSLRRRFGNALQWYNHLTASVAHRIENKIDDARRRMEMEKTASSAEGTSSQPRASATNNRPQPLNPFDESHRGLPGSSTPKSGRAGEHADGNLPSKYLRSRCFLCFGKPHDDADAEGFDAIACLDACFTQKRQAPRPEKKSDKDVDSTPSCRSQPKARPVRRDPPRYHPNSVFILDMEIKQMEEEVARLRSKSSSGSRPSHTESATQPDVEEDKCEGPLRVPNSVLDGCESSFKAADEQREKASTNFFEDTGLMALICRHDRVLWIANMRSAGERQHYSLALLRKLFQHLPTSYRMGILYDIGCQLHRSCYRWKFLSECSNRIVFAISVFHAYGHQWPCQLVYHPRKCKGFGLCDGEGCERFWSAIHHLVAVLRVSGYHQRLYVLDSQIAHLDSTHRRALGHWLSRKHNLCLARLAEANEELRKCNVDLEVLDGQWVAQQAAQTRPIKRQSKNAGEKAIDAILRMDEQIQMLDKYIAMEERKVLTGNADPTTTSTIKRLNDDRSRVQLRRTKYYDELSLENVAALTDVRKNKFLEVRMNALALKTRVRERLRQRKFELAQMKRSIRTQSSGNTDRKLSTHTSQAVQRREPAIQSHARLYNAKCREMGELVRKGQAPPGAVVPDEIDLTKLWTLDVDDNIWQDTGLLDDETASTDGVPPLWLADEQVRKGIRAMLEVRRCEEELSRIRKERSILQEWARAEWEAIEYAIKSHGKCWLFDVVHQLRMRRGELLRLIVTWRRRVGDIDSGELWDGSWGPTSKEI
ncbi:hypothetical protein PUNSTDRAFT_60270, partial [Punctularia strigosozonata HHB-11173 SS5]|uniref:uncharacterized protein n=1 Tax=Punctularia strigosozonata (strain HHB-11173) TaxID=741275 RepID=UPI00044171B9